MEQLECTTKSEHRKGAHLTYEERVIIQIRHRDGRSLRSIAQEIGCAPNTVHNELRRGRVLLHNGKRVGYRAVNGQEVYESNREHCGRPSLHESKKAFLSYVRFRKFCVCLVTAPRWIHAKKVRNSVNFGF